MSVRKRYKKDGTFVWEFCITIQKKPRKQYRKSGFITRAKAIEAEQKAIAKYIEGTNLSFENTRFSELAQKFLESCKNKSKSTNRNYNNSYNKHLHFFYDVKIKDINSLMVEKWINDCEKTPNTIAECIKFCKAVFNYAIKHDIARKNPFLNIEKPKIKQKDRKRLTINEAINLLTECKKNLS